jgi:carbonic anhydrase
MRQFSSLLLSLGLIVSLTACQSQPAGQHATASHAASGHAQTAHWDYEKGPIGPAHWASLDCPDCAGKAQSPIDIPATAKVSPDDLLFAYMPAALSIVNNGHTVKVSSDKNSDLMIHGKSYNLLQYHFHAPSEHQIGGKSFPAEMHLVHQSADGEYAVVGVMIVLGNENPAFDSFWDLMPKHAGEPNDKSQIVVNAINLLPTNREYYHYVGSFTTPPCTEGVQWYVLKNPVSMSARQLAQFTALYDHNNRPIQPLNGRF